MSIFSDYSSSSEMHNNLTIDYYLALSSTKGSGITNIISIILQQAHDYEVAKITCCVRESVKGFSISSIYLIRMFVTKNFFF
ncbi:hypothetical protein J4V34_21080, partial [Escherichia coli]